MLRFIKILLFILIILFALAVHLRNDQLVTFNYYLGTLDLPFSLYMVIAICIGAILGMVAVMPNLIRLEREKSRLVSKIHLTEKELETLRIIPVKE
ncbi:MAG: LapA family protein [Gammaproteobacteria bacterium]|nr:LapA family protein [Gammaproteobacteria bacterium]